MTARHTCYLPILALLLGVAAAQAQPQELPLGSPMPQVDLAVQKVDGSAATIGGLIGAKGTVFIFWSNQCPWIEKYRDRIASAYNQYKDRGIQFVAVNANDATAFPQEAAAEGAGQGLPMPYIVDPGARFATAVGASRTPHVFAFDANKVLVYVGTIDDSPGDPGNVQRKYLDEVVQQLAAGSEVTVPKTKAFGCTLKYPN